MKKYIIIICTLLMLGTACKKSSLILLDPNNPTPDQSLTTEAGLKVFALGIIQKMVATVPDEGVTNIFHITLSNHTALGDEPYVPYDNYDLRSINYFYSITLPSG